MSVLPENKPKDINKTPRMFFVWGQSMSGKTYFARQFPNPILLNTDGNALKVDTPSVEIKNFSQFVEVLKELDTTSTTFETIIIDLVDDIEIMLKKYIIDKANEQLIAQKKQGNITALGDIPFGQGYDKFNSTWKQLMMNLSNMKYNIIFISHIMEKVENNVSVEYPSLSQKSLNVCLGRCDIQLQTKKLGNNYMKIITNKRDLYVPEDFKDNKIKIALKDTMGLF